MEELINSIESLKVWVDSIYVVNILGLISILIALGNIYREIKKLNKTAQ